MLRQFKPLQFRQLLADNGGLASVAKKMVKVSKGPGWNELQVEAARRSLYRVQNGQSMNNERCTLILLACGISPLHFERYLEPRVPSQFATDYDDAIHRVAAWSGNPADWRYGLVDPLIEIHNAWQKTKTPELRMQFLLLEAHTAIKAGEGHMRQFISGGGMGLLGRASAVNSWIAEAAKWNLGKLATFKASEEAVKVAENGPVANAEGKRAWRNVFFWTQQAYRYFADVRGGLPGVRILLPGAASEIRGVRSAAGQEPMLEAFNEPSRYASTTAISLGYAYSRLGNKKQAEWAFLDAERRTELAKRGDRTQIDLNLEVGRVNAQMFLTAMKMGNFSARRRRLHRNIDALIRDIGRAVDNNLLNGLKSFEWLANVRFSAYAFRQAFHPKTRPSQTDEMLADLRRAVKTRRGGGTSVFLFDPIYQIALQGNRDLSQEFREILQLGHQKDGN